MTNIAVIIPARNAAKTLSQAIDSALNSDLVTQVIVFDDASSDNTVQVLSEISDSRLTVLSSDLPVGTSQARNAALEEVTAEYVATRDADDVSVSGSFELLAAFLDVNPSVVSVSGQVVCFDSKLGPWRARKYPTGASPKAGAPNFASCAMLCRTEGLRRLQGPYKKEFVRAQDTEMLVRLRQVGDFANLAEDVLLYRHQVLVRWHYWKLTQEFHSLATNGRKPEVSRARFLGSSLLRLVRWAGSTKRLRQRYGREL